MLNIGITLREEDLKYYIRKAYLDVLHKFNAFPVFLYPGQKNFYDVLSVCQGFIITGGDDIDPKYFNEENEGSTGVNQENDLLDQKIINYAIKKQIPLLGICRGMQAINIFMGGTIYQNVGYGDKEHLIEIVDHLPFLKQKVYKVNSFHHQKVKDLAENLLVFAKNKDTIEGFYHKYLPIIGVQWHPELDLQPLNHDLFTYFFSLIICLK